MGYVRVIPRDLFNEADLLKCVGKLYLELENINKLFYTRLPAEVVMSYSDEFLIDQCPHDGSIYIKNVHLVVREKGHNVYRPLNTRVPWNVYIYDDNGDIIDVFNENGTLSSEFVKFLRRG
jgi:hypothetical protein